MKIEHSQTPSPIAFIADKTEPNAPSSESAAPRAHTSGDGFDKPSAQRTRSDDQPRAAPLTAKTMETGGKGWVLLNGHPVNRRSGNIYNDDPSDVVRTKAGWL